jgi:hypothetical protein
MFRMRRVLCRTVPELRRLTRGQALVRLWVHVVGEVRVLFRHALSGL